MMRRPVLTIILTVVAIVAIVNIVREREEGGDYTISPESSMIPGMRDGYPGKAMQRDEFDASSRALVGNMVMPQPPGYYGGGATEVPASERLVVRTGYMSLVAKDVGAAVEQIVGYVTGKGGFVAHSSIEKSGVAPVGTVTVRVAVTEYLETVREIKKYGEVVSETTNGQDVTEEYVDLESRLKNLQAAEQQLLEIMKRAGKISEVLEVQQQLTQTRSEIEMITGRMKYLKQSSDFSTLTIHISSDPAALPVTEREGEKWKPIGVIKDAVRELIALGQSLVDVLIWAVIFAPVWGGALLVGWLIYRKMRKQGLK